MSSRIKIPSGSAGFTEDKDEARQFRISKIVPALEQGEKVVLDFSRVNYATQSYVHALIGEVLQRFGEPVLNRIEFKHCSPSVRSVIELVVDYSLAGFVEEEPTHRSARR